MIAFEADGTGEASTHLVHIEAKAYLGWNNAQLNGKAARLRAIFGEDGARWAFATPHYVLMSAKRSPRVSTQSWPRWMKNGDDPVEGLLHRIFVVFQESDGRVWTAGTDMMAPDPGNGELFVDRLNETLGVDRPQWSALAARAFAASSEPAPSD